MESTLQKYITTRYIAPSLFIGGILAGALGLVGLMIFHGILAFCLFFAGVAAIAMAQLLELLFQIADHLAAIRAQVGKGVLGLLG